MERSEQELVRRGKLEKLESEGFSYPNNVTPTASSADVIKFADSPDASSMNLTLAGRIVTQRHMGKAAFFNLLDHVGKIQIYIKKDEIGEENYNKFVHFDIGDIVEVSGFPFITKTGEKSLHAKSIRILTKSLIPLPEKWHGLKDVEMRYRHRYVDLIANHEVRDIFRKRSQIIAEIRNFFNDRGYLEVETPVLNSVAGGATARPFKTHHNALSLDMNLRIALELPLKKLIVGGFDKVYEIGRVFRNEGISKKHNPEFTMIEFYQAYATYTDLMDLTEELFVKIVNKIHGTLKINFGEQQIDFTPPWPRVSMAESLYQYGGVDRSINVNTLDGIRSVATKYSIPLSDPTDWGRVLAEVWEHLVEAKLINPTFLTMHPSSISPLARKNDSNPEVTDRFELIIAGMESANAFSELNDPIDQRTRFEAQAARKAAGDHEAPDVDEDFLRALEYGMPPTAGEGIGIDRLVMLLTNSQTIRDIVLFPQMKPDPDEVIEEVEEAV